MARRPPDPVFTLKGCMQPVHSLMFNLEEDKEFIYAGTQGGKVHLWDLKINREVKCYEIGVESCFAIHRLPNSTILTQDKSGNYKLWSENEFTKEWTLKRNITLPYFGFCRSIICEKSRSVICPLSDSGVIVINLDDIEKKGLKFCDDDDDNVSKTKKLGEVMVIKLFDNFILVAYISGVIKVWSVVTNKCVYSIDFLSDCPMALDVQYVSESHDKMFGYVGSSTEIINEFYITIDRQTQSIDILKKREVKLMNPGVSCITIRPDCKLFAAGCWDKRLRLFSCKSLKLLVVLDFHKDIVQDIIFSYSKVNSWCSQFLLAAGSIDGRISLWDLYN